MGCTSGEEEEVSVEFGRLVPVKEMRGEDDVETAELRRMYAEARAYLSSHQWCEEVGEALFGYGVGAVVAVFLFRARLGTRKKEWLWVVVGDLPTAYLVSDQAPTAEAALRIYTDLMEDWVHAVRNGSGLEAVFPVEAPADEEHADLLDSRIGFLREKIIPEAAQGSS